MSKTVGVDIGSTTAKVVVTEGDDILFQCYERHFSQVRQKTLEIFQRASMILGDEPFTVAISGSAGLGVAKAADVPFVQEVFATSELVRKRIPDADAAIELGGEDAKILFFDRSGRFEERMNGSCAGGTGAFIDQMATLLAVRPGELDALAMDHKFIYTIASRCGVFAKTDVQPLLNQGARKEDIAASIFQAVVDQTISGLAQGRRIQGKVLFLGGPLYFFKSLQQRFVETLHLTPENAVFPSFGLYSVSMGAAIYAMEEGKTMTYAELVGKLEAAKDETVTTLRLEPLFENEAEYDAFLKRHTEADVERANPDEYVGRAYLGIDCGSTTTKLCLMDDDYRLLYSYYNSNKGNPVQVVREQLLKIYELCGDRIVIAGAAVTGYGEDLIKNAFSVDMGLVETMAHLRAARHFNPQVDFVLDIGGQDIKCFKIRNGAIDNIVLNEACSSGCGSFIETFAKSMGYDVASFAKEGLFAKHPVDLGTRCTVFMNSSVKQAQKEGATLGDISAGLSMSVTKNAIYKVIRAVSKDVLGEHIVVQGGTFLNDAILRGFEREIGREVIRPSISGLMGAYGAALYAKELGLEKSAMMGVEELKTFKHTSKTVTCGRCNNNCNLTINIFDGNRRFISGNRCEKPLGIKQTRKVPNMFQYKLQKIRALKGVDGGLGKIGIPMGLNMYENIPFWHAFLTRLGFEVVLSDVSTRALYRLGQDTIPSDTACYPAKLMHGHIKNLLDKGITRIFYPCLPYNFDEKVGDNHYNCPVVAYYPELLDANMDDLKAVKFYRGYLGIHRERNFPEKAYEFFKDEFNFPKKLVKQAAKEAYAAYDKWEADIREEGKRTIEYARKNGMKIIVLAGRPYHVDPEINHGLDKLLTSLDLAIVTEDAVAHLGHAGRVKVLNQWTYHARLYNAAQYVTTQKDMELIQIVSFGCGIDAITTDEVRAILEDGGKLYTQLKIDEINNLSAIRIRIRSLLAALAVQDAQQKEKEGTAIHG
jgi:predicted CoA-substrate-specific enzyme activase